ncbi:ABC-type proline/glycine betaine transport system, ATPase component [Hoeflea sp. IMCC20628]|uniref:quaternary amine ABC transporter ATP-binding protein n=1 Tax=Hoeflea sp. IMCC20628 TaxID=1620421 RepID=UPI00063AB8A1|nr:ATP-binding cassette domain-containing protein [Hoeflea sp. IMCC20628]AKI01836.1 ABC-type proline/glycine betaine transport system, ATPase component [Hoeflea sp. IMCC20628]
MLANEADRTAAEVKVSCRNLWKVFGPNPDSYFDKPGDEIAVDALAARMRDEDHLPAVIDVSFDVHVGEIFVIMGLSGSGKSTVVRCLSRLIEASHGQVLLDDEDLLSMGPKELIEVRRHKMGMVFQNFGLLPHLTVLENVAFPLRLQKLSLVEQQEKAQRVIELVGLTGREQSFPGQLSGGQQQRVGIARSLAVEPDLWLLDEPFSALDPLIRRQMQDEFLRIQRVLQKSIVFITHDFLEALRIADRMAIMRAGKIVQIGTPEELILNPVDDYVAQFASEVPRIRVLRAGECTVEMTGDTSGMQRVSSRTTAENLVSILSGEPDGIIVEAPSGVQLGIVTPASLIRALASAERKRYNDAE